MATRIYNRTYPDHYSASDLRDRGWSPTLIKKQLGKPDLLTPNVGKPGWKRWWIKSKVEEIESTDGWAIIITKSVRRSQSLLIAHKIRKKTKMQDTITSTQKTLQ